MQAVTATDSSGAVPAGPGAAGCALPGSLAADLCAGRRSLVLLFVGNDAGWPAALASSTLGRPQLAAWLDEVLDGLDEWARDPQVRALGLFSDGFGPLVRAAIAADGAPDAGRVPASAPFSLVGTVLANLAGLAGLAEDGLGPAMTGPAIGHSAGLFAAWAAATSAEPGLVPVGTAVRAAAIAAVAAAHAVGHPWSVPDTVVDAALTGALPDPAGTPMAAVAGPRRSRLAALLGEDVAIGVAASATRHVLTGPPAQLATVRARLEHASAQEAGQRARGQLGGAVLQASWQPVATSAPFHHPALAPAADAAVAQLEELGLAGDSMLHRPVLDPATGHALPGTATVAALVASVLCRPHDWSGTLRSAVPAGSVAVTVSPLGSLGNVSASALRGRGALVLDPGTASGREALFTPGRAPAMPETYHRFAPSVVRDAGGRLRLANRHTRASGRSPMILPGMTPTTAEVPIVAAAANGGHVAELAGGGQVSERIFTERVAELAETLDPGQEVVINALQLDPHLWALHLGRDRLVQRARAAGAPLAGVTISAGVPERAEALALLDELAELGMWLNAFKPGTVAGVDEVLAIAADCPHTIWLHLEGGTAGGHHTWEDLEELLLATYHRIRSHANVVLAVGGGIGDPDRAAALLTGTWAHAHGETAMPVDAVLLGTVTMATAESGASDSVKQALVAAPGHDGWVARGQVRGGTTSGRSGLDADIHYLDNAASRAARLLDEVAGDPAAVARRADEIIAALAGTAKPFFGDVAAMTYEQVLRRFVELTALGRHGRYEDGAWLDPTHRQRFIDLLQRAEARLHPDDRGDVPTLFAQASSVDDPAAAVGRLVAGYPQAATALLHPADVDHFQAVVRRPGKPVPFVPVLDADVRRWFTSDALWQSHNDRYEADQVLVIPGPAAVAGIQRADEPVAALLDRFESAVAASILADAQPAAVPFRLGGAPLLDVPPLVRAALAAPTWQWRGRPRPNPLHRLAAPERWSARAGAATWSQDGESAVLQPSGEHLELVLSWPDLGIPGDGRLVVPVRVSTRSGVVVIEVTELDLAESGGHLLALLGSAGAGDPRAAARAHAATVGAAAPLPDRVMSQLWPSLFAGLAGAGVSAGILELVHLGHAVQADAVALSGDEGLHLARSDAGLVVASTARAGDVVVTDQFLVRGTQPAPDLPQAAGLPRPTVTVAGPRRRLGSLTLTAPQSLATFATVTGDINPIHRSDLLARLVGLPGRIVHGMWTSAAASRAVLEQAADGDPGRIRAWSVDFLAPVLPGQAVTITLVRTGLRAGAAVVAVEAATDDGVVATGEALVAGPRTAYVFPGQGIQSQGMGMAGYARSTAAREVWDRADRVTRDRLGFSVLEVVGENPTVIEAVGTTFRHPEGVLNLTQFTQVAMATLAQAQVAEMVQAGAFDPTAAVAGHSVGEYNALATCSGVLPLERAIELVFARGLAMHGLVPRGADGRSDYGLAVVRPHLADLSAEQLQALVADVAAQVGQLCQVVNHNLRGKQYAVAGTRASLAELAARLGPPRRGRAPLVHLPGIDVPFHSDALRGAVAQFRGHLQATLPERIDADALVGRYIPNLYPHLFALDREYVEGVHAVCGSPALVELLADWEAASADRDALARALLVELLAWQFASPVRWIESFELMCAPVAAGGLAIERLVEVGVASAPTLAGLAAGALALPSHVGTRPEVLNVDADPAALGMAEDRPEQRPGTDQRVDPEPEADPVPEADPGPTGAAAPPAADLPVDHAAALAALLALRAGVRPDQLGESSIDALVAGASSRRNQILMDIGKEFGVPAVDGAHDSGRDELAAALAQRAPGYRHPGPVLGPAVDAAVLAALAPLGGTPGTVAARVRGHWALGEGWVARASLALAVGTRSGASRAGGPLATLSADSVDDLIDAAVAQAAASAGVTVAPPARTTAEADPALAGLREDVENLLAGQAEDLLARLGRQPRPEAPAGAEQRDAITDRAQLVSEHGPASLVAGRFDPRRHVLLDSAAQWARADVAHLVQAALGAESCGTEPDAAHVEAWLDRIAVHRDADPRIAHELQHERDRLADRGCPGTLALLDRAGGQAPRGVPVAGLASLRLPDGPAADALAALRRLVERPGGFAGRVALVTGASPGSIAWSATAHLLRGGATVVVVTSSDTPERIAAYRDLAGRWAAPGARLHVIGANLASLADIDAVVEWLADAGDRAGAADPQRAGVSLWPDLVLPFAAAGGAGQVPDAGADSQHTLRLLLTGVQRLVGRLAERGRAAGREPVTVVLPMSPNHGTFGGDGAYGEAKAGLAAMVNRWHSEQERWGARTRLVAPTIGWVRGTGLMAGNDGLAAHVEAALGVTTFSAEQMGGLIAALGTPELATRAASAPLRVDLSGGLADVGPELAATLAGAGTDPAGTPAASEPEAVIPALPGLPPLLAAAREPAGEPTGLPAARVAAEDMIVLVGVAEYGPWGSSWTRREAEAGELSAAGVLELAWRCGLVSWDRSACGWVQEGTGTVLAEDQAADRLRAEVMARCGVRPLSTTDGVAADGAEHFAEVFCDRPVSFPVRDEARARALAADAPGATVHRADEGWTVVLPAGTAMRLPARRPLRRSVGGQLPTGSDPVRWGLDPAAAAAMDPLAAWNLVVTAEALCDAGVSAEELLGAVHPGLVGNTQGTGMGGMSSIRTLHRAPLTGEDHANDVLQEALANVVAAHVNQSLVGGYGPMVHPVAACATAAVSLEEAVDKIALGKAEVVVAGGWDDLGSEGIDGFAEMAATADNAEMAAAGLAPSEHSRPGDRRRGGFVEAQGGGSFLVCRGSVALALGLPVRAVVAYAGSFGDGIHTSIPAPGQGALGAARGGPDSPLARALAGLGLVADDIAVVSKHDTSTRANDPNEARIHDRIQQALGRSAGNPLRVVSQKALTGHAKGGAAAWQVAGLCDVFDTGIVPGNRNLTAVDPQVTPGCLTVDHRALRRHEPVRAALLTSLGFGHVSAVVALAHPDVFAAAIDDRRRGDYLSRARQRRVAGVLRRLAAQHGGPAVFRRRTQAGAAGGAEQEAAMLLDARRTLPAPGAGR